MFLLVILRIYPFLEIYLEHFFVLFIGVLADKSGLFILKPEDPEIHSLPKISLLLKPAFCRLFGELTSIFSDVIKHYKCNY